MPLLAKYRHSTHRAEENRSITSAGGGLPIPNIHVRAASAGVAHGSRGRPEVISTGTAAFGAIIIYQLLREREPQPEEAVTADAAVGEPEQEPEAGAGE